MIQPSNNNNANTNNDNNNNYNGVLSSPETKLQVALEIAESLAELHGFAGGVIVHGDVQLGQWLQQESTNGRLVLGDFNLAKVLS